MCDCHAAHLADERPSGQAAPTTHFGCCHPLGYDTATNRHRAGQLHLWRHQISLCCTRATFERDVPSASRQNERVALGCRRGALHIAMGLRLPTFISANQGVTTTNSRHSDIGTHRLRNPSCSRGYYEAAGLRKPEYSADFVPSSKPLVQCSSDRR